MLASELQRQLRHGGREPYSAAFGCSHVVVELDQWLDLPPLPCPVVAVAASGSEVPDWVDVVVPDLAGARRLGDTIDAHPQAAAVLAQLLRNNARASVADGLVAESLAYSTLQAGREFATWLAGRERRPVPPDAAPPVRIERSGDRLAIVLNRPARRNAYSAALRDALCEALQLLAADSTIEGCEISGAGVCFSAGGDLDEFGTLPDPATGHVVRTTRSAGALIDAQRARITCRVHGACVGAGIELPAFAGRVVAAPDAFFVLPEVGMGLVPGAGGTVSITRRIGRRRCAFMALSGERVDARTALQWGLVDEIG